MILNKQDCVSGIKVAVPCYCVEEFNHCSEAMVSAPILNVYEDEITVDVGDGKASRKIDISKIHKSLPAILIVNFGDIKSEKEFLDPLAKSILHYCRLFFKDPTQVELFKTRSVEDLGEYWNECNSIFNIVIFISHGCSDGLLHGINKKCLSSAAFIEIFKNCEASSKLFISLSCQTGGEFGKTISTTEFCEVFIGPKDDVHGALASQFCQSFLVNYLMNGANVIESFKKAKLATPGTSSFTIWKNGESCDDLDDTCQ